MRRARPEIKTSATSGLSTATRRKVPESISSTRLVAITRALLTEVLPVSTASPPAPPAYRPGGGSRAGLHPEIAARQRLLAWPVYRQPDLEVRLAGPGDDVDVPAVAPDDDAVTHVEPEARALADTLRRKERLEDALPVLLRDARAVVGDLYQYQVALAARPEPDAAGPLGARDGVYGIVHKVGPDLVELAPVGGDARHFRVVVALDLYAFELVAEHDQRVVQAPVHVHGLHRGAVHVRVPLHRLHDPGDAPRATLDLINEFGHVQRRLQVAQRVGVQLRRHGLDEGFEKGGVQPGADAGSSQFPALGDAPVL